MDFEEIDQAIAAAKSHWDHADAPYEPDVLALIRAAEEMRRMLDAHEPSVLEVIRAGEEVRQILNHPGTEEVFPEIRVRMLPVAMIALNAAVNRLGINYTDTVNRAVQQLAQILAAPPGRSLSWPNPDGTTTTVQVIHG